MPVRGQRLDQFPLGAGDALDPPDPLGVGAGHRRHDADRGQGDVAQAGDLAEPAHAHLEHQHLDVRPARRGSITGRPCSLLKLRTLAVTRRVTPTRRRHQVLGGLVLPTLPVIATTGTSSPACAAACELHQRRRRVGDLDRRPAPRRSRREVHGGAAPPARRR